MRKKKKYVSKKNNSEKECVPLHNSKTSLSFILTDGKI